MTRLHHLAVCLSQCWGILRNQQSWRRYALCRVLFCSYFVYFSLLLDSRTGVIWLWSLHVLVFRLATFNMCELIWYMRMIQVSYDTGMIQVSFQCTDTACWVREREGRTTCKKIRTGNLQRFFFGELHAGPMSWSDLREKIQLRFDFDTTRRSTPIRRPFDCRFRSNRSCKQHIKQKRRWIVFLILIPA